MLSAEGRRVRHCDHGDEMSRDGEGDRRFFIWLFGFIGCVFVLGLIAIAYAVGFSNGKDEGRKVQPGAAQVTTETQAAQPAVAPGKDLFVSTCGECHTMSAAGTTGTEGPNLDDLKPDQATVLATIQEGPGAMPSNLLSGAQAQQVAAFVAANAGR